MKIQQWQLRKVTEPRTLADVESSRDKPVLCWYSNSDIRPAFVLNGQVNCIAIDGVSYRCVHSSPSQIKLFHQPSRPKTLDDVPDRRVILSGVNYSLMMFRESDEWFAKFADRSDEWSRQSDPPSNWKLTDHCVELVETEVGVMG